MKTTLTTILLMVSIIGYSQKTELPHKSQKPHTFGKFFIVGTSMVATMLILNDPSINKKTPYIMGVITYVGLGFNLFSNKKKKIEI